MVITPRIASRALLLSPQDHETWLGNFTRMHIDIGTGDGTFALRMAKQCPELAVIGLDSNLDNVTKAARRPRLNLRFVSGDAVTPHRWLLGRADSVSINFPYGTLFQALASDDDGLASILAVAQSGAQIDIRVNASAGASSNIPLERIACHLRRALRRLAPLSATVSVVPAGALRSFPSTWAKRLAYGRPSEVVVVTAVLGK